MYCGSCLHDNTLARALQHRGIDVQLIPTYTPIRTDEEDVSSASVFYGGLNVYLSQTIPFFRHLPPILTRWLDRPGLIRWATKRASATSAASLGALTVSMLRGIRGNQRRELEQLCDWLADLQPQLVVLSNALIAGCVPQLKQRLSTPVLVTLQGDDIFLDSLPESYREQSLDELRKLVPLIDGFLVNSDFYTEHMGTMLEIPIAKFAKVPLGLDVTGFPVPGEVAGTHEEATRTRPLTIGYLARLAPEKGFHVLIDAFIELRRRGRVPGVRLHAAGWKGPQHAQYYEVQLAKLREAGCDADFHYAGSVNRSEKIAFLHGLDLLSVPTTYKEPKGLFVLESLAAGVPVVQPNHGAFPELLAATGGGRLVPPNDPVQLAVALEELLLNGTVRRELGQTGQQNVHTRFNADAMAASVWSVWQRFLG
jgi:glycosyltransferase involved in cell wall biosynthesis